VYQVKQWPQDTALGYTRFDWGQFSVLSSSFHEKMSAIQVGFE
jgi:hypothetical protein